MDKKIKILVLADGASIHTDKWIRGLSFEPRFEIYLINLNTKTSLESIGKIPSVRQVYDLGTKSVKTRGGNFHYLLKLPAILTITNSIKPNIIATIYLTSYGLLGALVRKRSQKLFHFVIGSDVMVTARKNFVFRKLAQYTLRQADIIMSVSQTLTSVLMEICPEVLNRTFTMQYGIDESLLAQPMSGDHAFTFVSNRAWVPNSNIEKIVSAFSRTEGPYKLALIGKGGPLEAEINHIVQRDQRIQMMGFLDYPALVSVVHNSKFFLSWTSSDGASLSLLEAMALGAIPIVSDIEPNREWIKDGENGYLVPVNNIEKAVEQLKRAVSLDKLQIDKMRERNRILIAEKGCFQKNMKYVCQRLTKLI